MNNYQTRIKKLIKYGHGLAMSDRKINMRHWLHETKCGTSGCLIGWALHDNLFTDPAFHLTESGLPMLESNDPQLREPNLATIEAIAAYLGMPLDDAQMIFIEPTTLAECLGKLKRYFYRAYPCQENPKQ